MEYKKLGRSDLNVSRIALGTMTFGRTNTEAESFEQMDYALAQGINLFDAAEMYPVPTDPKYQGNTERYIGNWLKARGTRDKVVIATKAAGPGEQVSYIRPDLHFDRANLRKAVEDSLSRLQTDYIDLYQLHWPDRSTNMFGRLGYEHKPESDGTPILETLQVLKELVDEGKIRHVGLSNETAWGTMKFLQLSELHNLPRPVSVQNPYNLLNRSLEVGLSEVMLREQVDLLAYSPMAFGVLSGKYLGGVRPEGSRLEQFPQFARYMTDSGLEATEAYVDLAKRVGMEPAMLALAFVNSRDFLGSNIIGATRMEQLKADIASLEVRLSADLLAEIEAIHRRYTYPCP
ncbi:Oxidoreductase, aldo/keto reductase family [Marinobacterium lacunae]|uniref:Protein tas n=1 Tax=Marinobacterium lacunae TaxID=1232683 RepID=A0A081FY46_9GAMM|nr:NADP(H)-dependent aldo-keto reductase [Marinobacterium lacunae]KEA63451.1 Oxidoreductase, aldo/keto reductase family [Marinobacterium lacunae]MBR9885038.1 NADP(H)-dependent aldo-keto reductase [Oceanospirillales bacterium]